MKIIRTDPFKKDFGKLPDDIKRQTEKTLKLLAANPFHPFHPSLHIKKTKGEIMKGFSDIFEGRITKRYRFLCLIKSDVITLLRCGKHDEFF